GVVLDEDVERLQHARADSRRGQLIATDNRGAGAGEVLQLRLVRVQLSAEAGENADDHEPDACDREGAAQHEAGPTTPRAVLRVAAVDESLRHHANAVD